jgi:hypothetical protein
VIIITGGGVCLRGDTGEGDDVEGPAVGVGSGRGIRDLHNMVITDITIINKCLIRS